MANNERYRHELKYEISYSQYLRIKRRLDAIMKIDRYAYEKGSYIIRSIYFDNLYDTALKEKIAGVSNRSKFRIRYYNDDFSYIKLEKKMKYNGLCKKLSARINKDECMKILSGDIEGFANNSNPLISELCLKMKNNLLKPRVLVSYRREPYVYFAGNVRVTFDFDIRTTLYHSKFLEQNVYDISTEDNSGRIIMEVKYDDFLPDIVKMAIQEGNIRVTAFSKYCECRKFG